LLAADRRKERLMNVSFFRFDILMATAVTLPIISASLGKRTSFTCPRDWVEGNEEEAAFPSFAPGAHIALAEFDEGE
jgi:hypothetical protein